MLSVRDKWLVGALAVAALLYWKRDTIVSYTYSDDEALANANVLKTLDFIGQHESRGRYDVIFGGQTFTDFSDHPNIRVPFTMPKTGEQTYSTAAGKYQITHPTWLSIQASRIASGRGALPDFSERSQDLGAIEIMRMDGDLVPIYAGDWPTVLDKLKNRWASMPNDPTGQSHLAYADALAQLGA